MIVEERLGPAQIHRDLAKKYEGTVPNPVPNPKTIQRIWREWTTDDSEAWRFADEDMTPEDARLVLEVLDALNATADHDEKNWNSAQPRVRTVTKVEAKWIVRISRTAPRVPVNWCYALARAYIAAEAAGRNTQPLDRLMASRIWDVKRILDIQEAETAGLGHVPEEWESIKYATDLLPYLPETWRPEVVAYKREAEEAEFWTMAHDAARDAGFTDDERGDEDDKTQ